MRYAFADCVLDTDRCELYLARDLVKLEPKSYEVLVYLVQHAERLVTHQELLEYVAAGLHTGGAYPDGCPAPLPTRDR